MNPGTSMAPALETAVGADDHRHGGLQQVLGVSAWKRLPEAVRARFADPPATVEYRGEFEVVRASVLGRALATLCRLLGTPVVARTGERVPAVVRVGPRDGGVAWNREYAWPDGRTCLVRSTKFVDADGTLVEHLPARLCMPLRVRERGGALHFLSLGYYFRCGRRRDGGVRKLWIPRWASPGVTHVEHRDEDGGWFRFTMTVTHPWFGELFHQTGRFHAAAAQLTTVSGTAGIRISPRADRTAASPSRSTRG